METQLNFCSIECSVIFLSNDDNNMFVSLPCDKIFPLPITVRCGWTRVIPPRSPRDLSIVVPLQVQCYQFQFCLHPQAVRTLPFGTEFFFFISSILLPAANMLGNHDCLSYRRTHVMLGLGSSRPLRPSKPFLSFLWCPLPAQLLFLQPPRLQAPKQHHVGELYNGYRYLT